MIILNGSGRHVAFLNGRLRVPFLTKNYATSNIFIASFHIPAIAERDTNVENPTGLNPAVNLHQFENATSLNLHPAVNQSNHTSIWKIFFPMRYPKVSLKIIEPPRSVLYLYLVKSVFVHDLATLLTTVN